MDHLLIPERIKYLSLLTLRKSFGAITKWHLNVCDFLKFEYDVPGFNFLVTFSSWCCLSFLHCGLVCDINRGKSIISISNIFLLFFSFWYSHYACVIICLCDPQLMDVLLCLFQSFYFYFSVWGFLLSYPQAERLFTQPCPIYYWDQQRHSSFLLQCFWSEALLFDSCLEFTSSLYIIHLFFHVLSVEVFSILIIVF